MEGSRTNDAEHLLRREAMAPDDIATCYSAERRAACTLTWRELGDRVRSLATTLPGIGIGPGDRVASFT
ncbi:hypothetical protein EAH87_14655 [Sphingomonas koreensis]|nr:hypothetical protein EAH87_14655 [Sphingomonas koreensis]